MRWQVRKCIPPVKKGPYDSSSTGLQYKTHFSYMFMKGMTGPGSGDSTPGHHSPASSLLKQRVRSDRQGLQQAKWLWEQSLETQVSTQVWDQIKSWLPFQDLVPTLSGAYSCFILLLVFGPFILNLFVKFISSRLESIKLQMPLMEIKMTYYHCPLDSSSCCQPWCCRPLHLPLSARSSYWTDFIVPIPNSN
jgi:hypothetical protein